MPTYSLAFGHGILAAVYQIKAEITYDSYYQDISSTPLATIEKIESVVFTALFDPSPIELETCCGHWLGDRLEQTMCSLDALVFASWLYESMPDTTVSIEVMSSSLYKSAWAKSCIQPKHIKVPNPNHGMWWHSGPDDQVTSQRARGRSLGSILQQAATGHPTFYTIPFQMTKVHSFPLAPNRTSMDLLCSGVKHWNSEIFLKEYSWITLEFT